MAKTSAPTARSPAPTWCDRLARLTLVGTRVGRYNTRGPDSVIRVRVEGTRLP